ncbi:rRNA methyltransferase 1, mitochondrial isoform X3 [Heterocephalus glaber]|uniref:rRNA methyltransferase 1, mitochondrial isoform X3 n=1 Tax=Heterocephalus glaber TaxID=10181 RepID=A0AAX6S6L5_HETGA|nr:rRNA methyltransferase 1, mitochondrial isoform X3 [Heterocephalus glaber]
MGLLWTIRAATRGCSDRLVARHFSQAARREVRPGGEELRRLRLDDLAPTPRLELLFGLSPCLLALRAARRRVARLLLQAGGAGLQEARAELLRTAEARDIPVLRPRRQKLDALCHYQMHQGVCMEVTPLRPQPYTEPGEASPSDDPQQLWLVLEGLQDPRNLGAVLRSAHFLGVDKIIISRRNRNSSSLHLQPEEGFLCRGGKGATSPGPSSGRTQIGSTPRTVFGIRKRKAQRGLRGHLSCGVPESGWLQRHPCATVCLHGELRPCLLTPMNCGAGDFEVETRGSSASCFDVGLAVGDGSLLISRVG